MKEIFIAATLAAALTGCAAHSSPEVNARHYVMTGMETHDANLVVNKADSIKAILPVFREAYEAGKADKARGITIQHAMKTADEIRKNAVSSDAINVTFGNNPSTQFESYLSPREAHLLGVALSRTYLDGYDGK